MNKFHFASIVAPLLLLFYILACRWFTPWADVYALSVYPWVSGALSWFSSLFPFALQEVLLLAFAAALLFVGFRRRWSWQRRSGIALVMLLWLYVWFYLAWCCNYSRSSIYARLSATAHTQYDEDQFLTFVNQFIAQTNAAWTPTSTVDHTQLEAQIKDYYSRVPARYGLSRPQPWQHPKAPLFSRLYSWVGVSGFMAPMLAESCVNSDVLPVDYPLVYAHEYAHLLGVSSEAEANWWAFQACCASTIPAVRYSGYKGILPYVLSNAAALLPATVYAECRSRLRPEVMADVRCTQQHWQALYSPVIGQAQDVVYDLFLRGNNVPSGRQNYSQVVTLLLSLQSP